MRKFILLLLVSPLFTNAQQNFEGTIRYLSYTSNSTDSSERVMSFGKTRVQTITREFEKNRIIETTDILDFEKGLAFNIDHATNTYTVDTFLNESKEKKHAIVIGGTQSILGYKAVKYGLNDTVAGLPITLYRYISPDLKYSIPEKYRQVYQQADFAGDNLCWLEMHVLFCVNDLTGAGDPDKKDSVVTKAIEILHGPVDESRFIVPGSYKLITRKDTGIRLKSIKVEESAPEPPPPPPPPKPRQKRIIKKN